MYNNKIIWSIGQQQNCDAAATVLIKNKIHRARDIVQNGQPFWAKGLELLYYLSIPEESSGFMASHKLKSGGVWTQFNNFIFHAINNLATCTSKKAKE